MSGFNDHIEKVHEYLQSRDTKEFNCPSSVDELQAGMPVQVGPGANPGIILRSDTFAELGNPTEGSTSSIMWTEDTSLLRDGHVTLIGPDIPELEGGSQPFGQVIMMAGKNLDSAAYEKAAEYQHISDSLEGYMVRSSSKSIWGRISRDVAAKGFTLETLARALMIAIKTNVPEVETMEIAFITTTKDDIRQLDEIAGEVDSIRTKIVKEYWKEKGYDLDEFDCDLNCSACSNQAVCDDIRELDAIRGKQRGDDDEAVFIDERSRYVAEITDACVGCQACIDERGCIYNIIRMNESGDKAIVNPDKCRGCGVCVPICPEGAIVMREKSGDNISSLAKPDSQS